MSEAVSAALLPAPHLGRVVINRQPNADLDAPPDVPLLGVKRTWRGLVSMSANDPTQTFTAVFSKVMIGCC